MDELIHIARRMRRIALQSAVGGMALSILGMFAAAFGYLPPIGGAIAQEIIDLAAVLNAVRVAVPPRFLTDFYSDYQQEKQQRCLCYRLWKALRRLNKDGNVYTQSNKVMKPKSMCSCWWQTAPLEGFPYHSRSFHSVEMGDSPD